MGVSRDPFALTNNEMPFTSEMPHAGAFTTAGGEATGTITCQADSAAADGDYVTVSDGINPAVTYEYDKSVNGVTAGHITWLTGTTADGNSLALQALIQANQPDLTVTDLTGVLTLTHKIPGAFANIAITKHNSGAVSAVTGMTGGTDPSLGTSATTTLAMHTLDYVTRIDSVEILNPTGFVADASNYWVLTLKKGSTVMASWSTLTGAEGTITANVAAKMTMSATDANTVGAAGDLLSLVITKTGSPAAFPAGRVVAHGRIVA